MINPAPIASQSSLNAGDHDELEIFLEICLIHFTNRSKVEEQRENTWLFKGKISPKSWAIEAVVEAIFRGRWSGSLGRRRGFGIGHELALIPLQSEPRSGHDRATIGRRS